MFRVLDTTDTDRLGFKVEAPRFLEFTDRPGIMPAPYMARAHGISLVNPDALRDAERDALLRASYGLVLSKLPKRTRRKLMNS